MKQKFKVGDHVYKGSALIKVKRNKYLLCRIKDRAWLQAGDLKH